MQSKLRNKLSVLHGSRHGFSLIEVLVVLAILVILFGLLFAPMMAGIDMAASGRSQARLQDTVRLAAEQMRRELANAVYVYPPPTYTTLSGPVTDYSQLVFVPAAMDAAGRLLTPKQPRTWTGSSGQAEYWVIRYYVKPPGVVSTGMDLGYDEKNPFVMVRQQGLYRLKAGTGMFEFGSENGAGAFVIGRAMSENTMTPSEEYDLPASSTICRACGQMEVGYVSVCPACSKTDLLYLHDSVQFRPERITGEALAPSENNTMYTARHGNWMGTPNNGTVPLGSTSLSATAPELQPRLVDYRWGGGGYQGIALDSFTPNIRSNIRLRWNSTNGTVQVGEWRTVIVHVGNCSNPGAKFYPLTIEGDTYLDTGADLASPTAPLVPIYPNTPATGTGVDPRMPISYRIEPERSDAANVDAKVVPQSTRVMALTAGGGDARRGQWTRVADLAQTELGGFEYSEYLPDGQTSAELRFNRYSPPSPDLFRDPVTGNVTITSYDLYISYYYRRNFDPVTFRDDVIYADYSTGEIINITLIPQRFHELQIYRDGAPNLVVPPDLPAGGVSVRTQAVVANARY